MIQREIYLEKEKVKEVMECIIIVTEKMEKDIELVISSSLDDEEKTCVVQVIKRAFRIVRETGGIEVEVDVSDIIGSESSEELIERVMQGIISSGVHYRTEKKMSSWKALIRSVGYNRSNGTMPVKINDEIFTSEKLKDAIWDMVERA